MGTIDLSAISSNLGPVGFWNSITAIRDLLSYRPGILFLQDLSISIHSSDKVKSWLSILFPQHFNVISVHTERLRKPDGRKARYHYGICTMLHRHWYTDLTAVNLARQKADVSTVQGHVLKITTQCKLTSELISIYNIYQHTLSFSKRQEQLWEILSDDIQTVSSNSKPWLAGGYFNAAGQDQRWGYVGSTITRSTDDRFNRFVNAIQCLVSSPAGATYWSPNHRHHRSATLDHFLFDRKLGTALIVFDRPSWHPSHDHHALFCFAPMSL
eukprot:3771095-Rhodomonas_salina.1